ncbi:MAG: hypothetical protein R3267_07775 [Paenisporosarcina sp.]|nr:hypothetical protein [Paenisporosarcina sp.]
MNDNGWKNLDNILVFTHNLKDLDGLVKKLREHFDTEKISSFWMLKPFFRALVSTPFNYDKTSSGFEKILAFFVGPFGILLATALGVSDIKNVSSFLENISGYWFIAIAGVLYLWSVIKSFLKQIDYNDPSFDLNAFKSLFPDLYQKLRVFKNTDPFSFDSLHSYMERLSEGNLDGLVKAIDQMDIYQKENMEIKESIAASYEYIDKLTMQLSIQKTLFDKSINAFLAIVHEEVSKDILHIFSDFALFELKGDKLITIAKQNAYNTPMEIDITDPVKKHWAVVKVVNATLPKDFLDTDENGDRVVIANKIVIAGETFVYTFHIPSRDYDEFVQIATEVNTQRLLYSLIRVYNKSKEGGNTDGDS